MATQVTPYDLTVESWATTPYSLDISDDMYVRNDSLSSTSFKYATKLRTSEISSAKSPFSPSLNEKDTTSREYRGLERDLGLSFSYGSQDRLPHLRQSAPPFV